MKPGDIVKSICPKKTIFWDHPNITHEQSSLGDVAPGDLMTVISTGGSYITVLHPNLGIGYFWKEYMEIVIAAA